jgi:hypothetical protein
LFCTARRRASSIQLLRPLQAADARRAVRPRGALRRQRRVP